MQPTALLIYVVDCEAGYKWYSKAFSQAKPVVFKDSDVRALQIGNILVEIVESDEKVSSGKSGTILYWRVDDLLATINHFTNLGSSVYRGPMQIEDDLGMCQVTDTFGNLIGLRGDYQGADGLSRDD